MTASDAQTATTASNGHAADDSLQDLVWQREGSKLPNGEIRFRCPAPGHEDRNPSARFSPEKQVFICDACVGLATEILRDQPTGTAESQERPAR